MEVKVKVTGNAASFVAHGSSIVIRHRETSETEYCSIYKHMKIPRLWRNGCKACRGRGIDFDFDI